MSWQLLVLANSLTAAIVVITTRAIARDKTRARSALVISAGIYIVQYLAGLISLGFIGGIQWVKLSQYLHWFILVGIGFALSNVFTYKLLSYLDAGISSVLGTLNIISTILFAAAFLHEDLSSSQAIGAFILLVSIIYVLLIGRKIKHHTTKHAWILGLGYALLAGLFYGMSVVTEKFLLKHMDTSTYMFFGWGTQVIAATSMAALLDFKGFRVFRKDGVLWLSALTGILRALGGILFLKALVKSNNVALITVVTNLRLIIVVLLAAWLLKERRKLTQKLIASAISLIGLSIIFWK